MSINSVVRSGLVATAIMVAGCAFDPQGGYRAVTQVSGSLEQPAAFDEANARCRTVSMNNAGYSATMAQLTAYQSCMTRNGWQDQRTLF